MRKWCIYKRDNAVWNNFRTHFQDNQARFFVSFHVFAKIYRYIYSGFPKGNAIVRSDLRIRGSVRFIEQGFKRRKGFSLIHFSNTIWKLYEWDAVNFIVNQFISILNFLHVEVYQNEISQSLPTVLFSVICCQSRVYHD